MRKVGIRIIVLLLAASCFCIGCNRGPQKPPGFPELFPCKITITQGGQPLEGASVVLFPKSGGSSGWNTEGVTNAQGIAELNTHLEFRGAPVGDYVVRVSKTEITPSAWPIDPPQDSIEREKWYNCKAEEKRTTYRLVKAEFGDQRTPHSITIDRGKNEATFDVGEAIKEEKR